MTEQLMILIAGPYRSGTGDDPALIQRNVAAMEDMALKVFRRGHLPVLDERFALPLLKHAGSRKTGDTMLLVNAFSPGLFALIVDQIGWHNGLHVLLASSILTLIAMGLMSRWYEGARR